MESFDVNKFTHKEQYYKRQRNCNIMFRPAATPCLYDVCSPPWQKKPKMMGKEHAMAEVNKHSTGTETMFFEKVGIHIILWFYFSNVFMLGRKLV